MVELDCPVVGSQGSLGLSELFSGCHSHEPSDVFVFRRRWSY